MSDPELHDLLGERVDASGGVVQHLAEEWIGDGKVITEMVVLLGMKSDGGGSVVSKSRAEFADGFRDFDPASVAEVLGGPSDWIPAVVVMLDVPAVHVTWINPVSSSEVH